MVNGQLLFIYKTTETSCFLFIKPDNLKMSSYFTNKLDK